MLMKNKMIYDYKLIDNAYNLMLSKKKKIEVRLLKEKSLKIQIGDEIIFHHIDNPNKTIKTKVVNKEIFNNLDDLLKKNDINKILFGASKEELEKLLKEIYQDELLNNKLVAFHLEY